MTAADAVTKKIITVVSAHEGAATWVNLCRFIDKTTNYEMRSFHQYDDENYRSARTNWERLALRIRTFVIFPLRFVLHAGTLSKHSDLLLVVTSPFFMPVLASMVVNSRRTKLIALMNDIYPEALVAKGLVKRDGLIERVAKRAFSRALRGMAAVVFISEHHKEFVAKDIELPARAPVIPVSAHSDPFADSSPTEVDGPVSIVYCGTLGLMHETSTFLAWLDSRRQFDNVRFAFYTSGASKRKFESDIRARLGRGQAEMKISLGNALAESEWVGVMKEAQVGLVFQDSGSGSIIFPSKIASILAAGQAVLAVADPDSDIARLIRQNDCGWVVRPKDVDAFEDCIRQIAQPELLQARRLRAFEAGHALFGKKSVARQWVTLFDSVHPTQKSDAWVAELP